MRRIERSAVPVIAMWRAIEMFDPPSIPSRPRPRDLRNRKPGGDHVQDVDLTGARELPVLPWQEGHRLAGEEPRAGRYGAVWRHTIYGGVFEHAKIWETLADHFGVTADEDFAGTRKSGETALFAITVDDEGLIFADTAAFSRCAWATGRAFAPGPNRPDWLDGFEDVEKRCVRAIGRLTHELITYTTDSGAEASSSRGWRQMVKQILGSAAEGAINALLVGLTGVIGAVGAGAATGAAKPIMSRLTKKFTGDGNASGEPDGEPGPPSRALTIPDLVGFAAHIAYLCGVSDLIDARKLRVKSEPVSRKRDGSLPDPDKPFLNSFFIDDLTRVIDAAPDQYGAALATYLTQPQTVRKKLEPKRIDVQKETGTALSEVHPDRFPAGRWPSDVGRPLVFSQQLAVNRIVADLMHDSGLFSVNGPPGTGKTTLLRDLIAAIIVARAEVLSGFRNPRDAFPGDGKITWEHGDDRKNVRAPHAALTGFEIVVASSNNGAVENITTELPALGAIAEEWRSAASYFVDQASAYLDAPAWGAVAAPLGKSEKRREFAGRFWYDAKFSTGESTVGMKRLLYDLRSEELRDPPVAARFGGAAVPRPVDAASPATSRDWQGARQRFSTARQAVENLRRVQERQGRVRHFPREFCDMPEAGRELASPSADAEWDRARSGLFLAALELHRALIANVPWAFRTNIDHLINAFRGAPDMPRGAELAAWQTLFLMVPVVSTTFASCGRLFAELGREELGWLLVDEAGQASPQQPVGALWRAKRAVLVGDPLQLEPIVQLPADVQAILRDCYDVSHGWLPDGISAQGVADRVNRWGTEVRRRNSDGEQEQVWVGSPLRVHRRCEDPMFAISNEIAYDGLMVDGTEPKRLLDPERWGSDYKASCWIHVEGGEHDGKWNSREGDALVGRLQTLHRQCGVPLAEIRVLSPFRDVVRNCKRRVYALRWEDDPPEGMSAGDYQEQVSRFTGRQIGTVHTMQGREADVVFLVLGTQAEAGEGARRWAAMTSNLLNVAVSRAKRRLFVIGNRDLWGGLPYFDALARRLGVWSPDEQARAPRL
ncbi:MAG TPA: ATP-binding protein [Streptosporangiaceae bacterium]|jgi:hypothetical protein